MPKHKYMTETTTDGRRFCVAIGCVAWVDETVWAAGETSDDCPRFPPPIPFCYECEGVVEHEGWCSISSTWSE